MILFNEEITQKLNDLLEHTYDAERGYKLAQEMVVNPAIKRFLGDKVQQRYNFGHQLRIEIIEHGYLRDNGGRIKGNVYRTWMKLTKGLTEKQTGIVLKEVERGQNESLRMYNDLLQDERMLLPESTKKLLIKQRNSIRAARHMADNTKELMA